MEKILLSDEQYVVGQDLIEKLNLTSKRVSEYIRAINLAKIMQQRIESLEQFIKFIKGELNHHYGVIEKENKNIEENRTELKSLKWYNLVRKFVINSEIATAEEHIFNLEDDTKKIEERLHLKLGELLNMKRMVQKPEYCLHELETSCATTIRYYNTLVTKLNIITNKSYPILNYDLGHTTPLKFNLEKDYLSPLSENLEKNENEQ